MSKFVGRAVVAMSGGVDSSVAAALLAREGYEVVGITMRLFPQPFAGAGRLNKSCCSLEDVEDARATCRKMGARHLYLNFEKEFQEHVIDYFVGEYERGRTPHPCLACNDRLKFDFLMRRADLIDADVVATGHYARIQRSGSMYQLSRAVDPAKDQSYVLYNLTQGQMARLRLPVGEFTKTRIREIARELDLPVADKPDSQDICFIPSGDYRKFVEARLKNRRPGVIRDSSGKVLGRHDGVHGFTVGQRKGLPIEGGLGRPVFVTEIDAATGTITVGPSEELMRRAFFASDVNWVSGVTPQGPLRASVRVRYTGRDELATVEAFGNAARITFDQPMRAITPGQAAVFYDGDTVIGGGYVELAEPAATSPEPALSRA